MVVRSSFFVALLFSASPLLAQAPAAAPVQPIPRAAFLQNMDSDFAKIDTNHDGKIGKQEVEAWQRANTMAEIMARNRAIFLQLDTNHDGQLSAQEFGAFHADPPPANGAPMVQHFDQNHDGVISQIEFRAGTLANFDRLDANKDGVVDAAEMKAGGIGAH